MKTVQEVRYKITSGSILPELQWAEEYIVTEENALLTRTGNGEKSQVNAGSWLLPVDKQSLQALFESLQTLNCTKLKRIEPVDPPDGGGSEEFIIVYQSGSTCSMRYEPGVSYDNGDAYALTIREFIGKIAVPEPAIYKHLFP